jgi:hypothetical protein
MNATATSPAAVFTVGQKLSDRSACDWDCIFRATVIKRTAKRVTLDLGRGDVRTVGIFIDHNGNEACFPFGRYSMASIFSAGDKYIEDAAAVAQDEPKQQAAMLQAASAILGVEVEEILSGGDTLPSNVIFHSFR